MRVRMRMRMHAKALAVSLSAAMLLLAACQPVIGLRGQDVDEDGYSGTIRIGLFAGRNSLRDMNYEAGYKPHVIQEQMKAFMEKYPRVQVEIQDITAFPGKPTAARDALNDPEGFDILELNVQEARHAGRGKLLNLETMIEEKRAQWDGGYMNVIESAMIDGIPYLLPVRSNPMLAYYDRLTFARLGVPEPEGRWTLEEFADAANRLTEAGLTVDLPIDLNSMEPSIRGLGGAYTSDDGRDIAGHLDSEATVQAFSRYASMMSGRYVNGAVLIPDRLAHLGVVRAGELHQVIRSDKGDYRIAPLPVSQTGERVNNSLLTGLAITANARQPDLAWKLMAFIVGDSSEAAMDFLARNTLEVHHYIYRTNPDPKDDALRAWMRSEAAIARPASFDLYQSYIGQYSPDYPDLSYKIEEYGDIEVVRADLQKAVGQLTGWFDLVYGDAPAAASP